MDSFDPVFIIHFFGSLTNFAKKHKFHKCFLVRIIFSVLYWFSAYSVFQLLRDCMPQSFHFTSLDVKYFEWICGFHFALGFWSMIGMKMWINGNTSCSYFVSSTNIFSKRVNSEPLFPLGSCKMFFLRPTIESYV